MGLGKLFSRTALTNRITEFAVIDGVKVDGSGMIGARYQGAMRIPGAWRAANLLADLVGGVPWDAYRQRAGKPIEKLDPTPPLLEQPAPPDTRITTLSSWMLDYLWNGNAISIVAARDAYGYPTAALPLPAGQVGVRRVGMNEGLPTPWSPGEIVYSVAGREFSWRDVIHVKGPCEPGALRGMGVLEHHMVGGALGLSLEQMHQANQLAEHGVPTGMLTSEDPDVTLEELEANKLAWVKAQRDRSIAAVNKAITFQPLSWKPDEMQMVESRRYTLTDLENIFGLPVGWLGGMNSARQYSNIEQDAVNLIKFSLRGHLERFEQTLSLMFPRGTRVKADLDDILRADTLTRYQAYAIGLANGFLETNEVRDGEGRPPISASDNLGDARNIAEMVQKVYLGVGTVITEDEAREILNAAGAGLKIPAPKITVPVPVPLKAVPDANPQEETA